MWQKVLPNFLIAADAVLANRMRSILTALGIIFGVAAVIAMLAIGNGAQQEILEQIKLVGVNNIVITPVVQQTEEEVSETEGVQGSGEKKNFSNGLTNLDVKSIQAVLPEIEFVSPEIVMDTYIIRSGIRRSAKLVGVENTYFSISNFELAEGSLFNEQQMIKGEAVCIIGSGIKARFFPQQDPQGKLLKVGNHWLRIIGVLEERFISEKSLENLGIRNYNMDVYTPINTALLRYKNRALVNQTLIARANNSDQPEDPNYHQLDKITVQVGENTDLNSIADIISRLLERRHYQTIDFQITIPELLLKQQQRTKDIFNLVLGAIAGISLLVGGIGIMNIMLASVLERIKEIGLRLAIGAQKTDVILQFLFEAVMISITGGIIGVVLGIVMAYLVSQFADIPTIVSVSSILLSFGVAASIGLIFGIAPARKAAMQDPISSLRYE
jgi:putative ABC transport system permease protein